MSGADTSRCFESVARYVILKGHTIKLILEYIKKYITQRIGFIQKYVIEINHTLLNITQTIRLINNEQNRSCI